MVNRKLLFDAFSQIVNCVSERRKCEFNLNATSDVFLMLASVIESRNIVVDGFADYYLSRWAVKLCGI
jgi:hypothetical protein